MHVIPNVVCMAWVQLRLQEMKAMKPEVKSELTAPVERTTTNKINRLSTPVTSILCASIRKHKMQAASYGCSPA
jgi:hypothetical protein